MPWITSEVGEVKKPQTIARSEIFSRSCLPSNPPITKARMIRFSIFRIPVEVQPFFWVTLVIIGGALRADSSAEIFRILLFVIAGFVSILIHELGHALSARAYGAHSRITLQAFGGYAAFTGVRLNRRQSFLVTAAGPAIQIVLGLLVMGLFRMLPEQMNQNGAYFLGTLMLISFFWAILNLLPVIPLDGGQMLNALLGPERIKITLWISIIVAVTAGLLMYYLTGSILFPIFLAMFAWQAFKALKDNTWG
jgi:Zn-dependent protease